MPFEISVPEGQCSGYFPAPSHKPYFDQRSGRNPQPVHRGWADPALDFAIFEPAGGHPEEVRGRVDHVNYKKLNQISKLSQLPIPRVDRVLDLSLIHI